MEFNLSSKLFVLLVLLLSVNAGVQGDEFDVVAHGAVGDGTTFDTLAFVNTWTDVCTSADKNVTMIIPEKKTFLVQPISFTGPCKSAAINIKLNGQIIAPKTPAEWKQIDDFKWLQFKNVQGLSIDGFGKINGRGKGWWDISCKRNPGQALSLIGCSNVRVSNIVSIDSPQPHIVINQCKNVDLGFLNLQAPEDSPNTDGIHIEDSQNVNVHNSDIGTGDDCVSIGDKTSVIHITDVNCGPGHGVSIGSLGKNGEEVNVKHIFVKNINFHGTTNGARIKTWQVGRGQARHIQFSNLNFTEVKNPIIIDQFYCDSTTPCAETKTGVHIDDVVFSQAFGTSATAAAINLNCTNVVPCTNVVLDTVNLTSSVPGKEVSASCNNAQGFVKGSVEPHPSCLSSDQLLRTDTKEQINRN